MTSFAYTIVYVNDVEKTIGFYEKAFGFKRKFIAPENDYGELNTGATTLSFAAVSLGKKNLPDGFVQATTLGKPFGVEVALATKDVEKVYNDAINAGATAVAPAQTKPWGQTVAYVRDINGFLIEICTPIE
jgi:lactoylglutathione lyase